MRKLTRPLACILFCLLSLIPLALFAVDGPTLGSGKIIIQPLAQFPTRVTPSVFRSIGHWFEDRIGLRMTLLSAGAALHVGVLHRSTSPNVVIGRDGWLFYDEPGRQFADFYGDVRFTAAEVQSIERELLAMHQTLEACGVRGLVAIAPDKQSIYGEYLSSSDVRSRTRLDDLIARLGPQARSMLLDLRGPLLAAKASDPDRLLYFKTDTHWNELGAFYGYRAIIFALARSMPVGSLALASLDQFVIEGTPVTGDIAASMLSSPSRFPETAIHLARKPLGAEDERMTLGGQMFLTGDSFSYGLARYFAPHFLTFQHEFRGNPVSRITADGPQPSAVVIEVVERLLQEIITWDYDWKQVCPQ